MKNTIENRYKCPKKLWNKMSEKGQIAYNNVRGMKPKFIHPNPESSISAKDWETISHNYACLAAWEF